MASLMVDRAEMTCALCRHVFSSPTTWPCGHTFCKSCTGYAASLGGEATCAECRARCPSADLLLLPVNKILDKIAGLCAATSAPTMQAGTKRARVAASNVSTAAAAPEGHHVVVPAHPPAPPPTVQVRTRDDVLSTILGDLLQPSTIRNDARTKPIALTAIASAMSHGGSNSLWSKAWTQGGTGPHDKGFQDLLQGVLRTKGYSFTGHDVISVCAKWSDASGKKNRATS
jgi:hypothetical protein